MAILFSRTVLAWLSNCCDSFLYSVSFWYVFGFAFSIDFIFWLMSFSLRTSFMERLACTSSLIRILASASDIFVLYWPWPDRRSAMEVFRGSAPAFGLALPVSTSAFAFGLMFPVSTSTFAFGLLTPISASALTFGFVPVPPISRLKEVPWLLSFSMPKPLLTAPMIPLRTAASSVPSHASRPL